MWEFLVLSRLFNYERTMLNQMLNIITEELRSKILHNHDLWMSSTKLPSIDGENYRPETERTNAHHQTRRNQKKSCQNQFWCGFNRSPEYRSASLGVVSLSVFLFQWHSSLVCLRVFFSCSSIFSCSVSLRVIWLKSLDTHSGLSLPALRTPCSYCRPAVCVRVVSFQTIKHDGYEMSIILPFLAVHRSPSRCACSLFTFENARA